jgi:hypothetical protein
MPMRLWPTIAARINGFKLQVYPLPIQLCVQPGAIEYFKKIAATA